MATKKPAKKRAAKRASSPHVYRMPKTAAELNVKCAECGEPAEYFDEMRVSAALYATEKSTEEHMRGFICGKEPRSAKAQKLLVSKQGISEREGLAQSANP